MAFQELVSWLEEFWRGCAKHFPYVPETTTLLGLLLVRTDQRKMSTALNNNLRNGWKLRGSGSKLGVVQDSDFKATARVILMFVSLHIHI